MDTVCASRCGADEHPARSVTCARIYTFQALTANHLKNAWRASTKQMTLELAAAICKFR
jgi:hypothetical protein